MSPNENVVVALTADMIFAARIRGAADVNGCHVVIAKNPGDYVAKIVELKPRLAVLDLDRRGLDVRAVIEQVRATGTEVLAYVSHVRADLIEQAHAAGAKRVLARGAFAKQLGELLSC